MREQANQMLAEVQILDVLSKHGDARIFGSYELDLMAWPEIDIWITNPDFRPPMAWDIVKDLSQVASPTFVFVANQVDHALGMSPTKAVTVDYRFKHRDTHWKLDIGISTGEEPVKAFAFHDTVKEKLTPATRALIKTIKERTVDSPKYLKGKWGFTSQANTFRSFDIYLAVLRDGVKTPQEFAHYLWEQRGIDVRADFVRA
jgi:hypothetical protein